MCQPLRWTTEMQRSGVPVESSVSQIYAEETEV